MGPFKVWAFETTCPHHLSAVASGGLRGQSLYLLAVQLSSSAVVLGVGSVGRAPMLTEKCHLR